MNFLPFTRYFRSERELTISRMGKIEGEQKAVKQKLKETEEMLRDRQGNIQRLSPQLTSLQLSINELENFEYPRQIETVQMVISL